MDDLIIMVTTCLEKNWSCFAVDVQLSAKDDAGSMEH